ncbi:hypothetical protein KI743_22230 [Vibrio sp. D420a]|uniref:hypothetical protein n=1 Tax=Vibrio sp. D420a TaxID=2836895 RepID=UPI0025543A99|nr:hypothetical protein [Vibrio sp. D420a]MDK9764725.1 hypothetical protein [Vibrio sp. D420a]
MSNTQPIFAQVNGTHFAKLSSHFTSIDGLGLNVGEIFSSSVEIGVQFIAESTGKMNGELSGTLTTTEYFTKTDDGFSVNVHGILSTEVGESVSVKMLGHISHLGVANYQIALRQYGELGQQFNHLHLFATGRVDVLTGRTSLKICSSETNPFGSGLSLYLGGNAFFDPDAPTISYKAFPFTLESLQSDANAQIIYAGQGKLNGIESFGVDIQAVLSGQYPIPEEGLRLNGYFSGPVQGSINGVISGRNFLRVMPDGSMVMNSKIIVRTSLGETLLLEALGSSFLETGTAWFETSKTVSNLDKYQHLTQLYNVGVGLTDINTQQIVYNHYGYSNNPFT